MANLIQYRNKIVTASGTDMNVREKPTTNSAVLKNFKAKTPAGRSTGEALQMKDGLWVQVKFYTAVNGKEFGYVRSDVAKFADVPPASGDGVALINNIISKDADTYHTSLRAKELINRLKQKGVNTSKQEKELAAIVKSLNARQQKIKNSDLLKTQTGIQKGYEWLIKKLGIGEPISLVVGCVIAVSLIGTAVLVYNYFQPDEKPAGADWTKVRNLEKALQNLSPSEAAELKEDIDTQVKEAYEDGFKDAKGDFLGGSIKNILLIGGGAFLAYKIINK
jgi:hypothetical protein